MKEEKGNIKPISELLFHYLRKRESTTSQEAEDEVWSKISKQISNKKRKHVPVYRWLIPVTAVAAASLLFVFWLNNQAYDTINSGNVRDQVSVTDAQTNHIELITATGTKIKVDEKATISYAQDGSLLIDEKKIATQHTTEEEEPMNQIIVPMGKHIKLQLSDGSRLDINSGSKVVYPQKFKEACREIFVEGEIFIDVTHKENNIPFIVKARINQSSLNTSIRIRHRMDYLVEGLSVRGALSYDHYFTKTLRVTPNLPVYSITRNPADPAELLYYGGEHNAKSYEETGWGKNRKVYVEAGIDFSRDFGKHAVTAMALVTGERYTSPGLKYNVPRGYYGVVGRVTYGYDQRYLAEFNMGYNGSENFAPGKRFGFFPAVSVGWVVSNEPYFPKNDILTWLKFRASYGQTGNSEIGGDRFLFLPGTWGSHSYGPWNGSPLDGYFFGSSNGSVNNPAFPGKYEQSTGNPDVTWEKKESYNIAAEVRMFRDRLSVTVDLFEEKRNNILTKLGVTPGIIGLSGSALPPVNVGRMSNRGYEIQVSWRDNVGTDFWYEVGGQVSYAVNKIDYKAEPSYMYAWMNETGFAYGQYKAYYNEGFYNTPEEVANHPYNAIDGNRVQGGDLRIIDVNGDGIIDDKDITPTGFSNVPRFAFSSNLSFGYKGFEISALLTGSAQGTFNMNGYLITPFAQGNGTPLSYMNGRWTPERHAAGKHITFPRMSVNMANSQNNQNNAFWFRSTDHIKLKNVEVAYTFRNARWMRKAHIGSIRVFVNANNLCTWGGKDLIDGIDPELVQDGSTSEGIIYPLTRVYNFGFNIQF